MAHRLPHAHGQQQRRAGPRVRPERARQRLRLGPGHTQIGFPRAQEVGDRRQVGQRDEAVSRFSLRGYRGDLETSLKLGHRKQHRAARAEEAARLRDQRLGEGARSARIDRGPEQARDGAHRLSGTAERQGLISGGLPAGPARGARSHTSQSTESLGNLRIRAFRTPTAGRGWKVGRLLAPIGAVQSPSVLAMMFFWISEVPP